MNWRDSSLSIALLTLTLVACDASEEESSGSDSTPSGATGGSETDGSPQTTTGDGSSTSAGGESETETDGESETETDGETDGGGGTSGEVPSDVNPPCIDPVLGVVLPEAVVNKAASNMYAQTAVDARDDIASVVTEIGTLPFPDGSATPAEVDDITVLEGDVAYRWGEYLYVGNGDGYSIYQDDGGLIPDEIIFVDQDAECSRFSLSHYAAEDDPSGADEGDALLFFAFNQAGTAKDFSWLRWDPEDVEFSMREFEDVSGDFRRNVGGQADLSLSWNAEGEGTFTRYEDGSEVESDLW